MIFNDIGCWLEVFGGVFNCCWDFVNGYSIICNYVLVECVNDFGIFWF